MTRAVLFDTETTGLEPLTGDRVVEFAAIELENDLPTDRHFHRLINPGRDIPEEVVRIHGITDAHVRDAPRFEAVVDDILAFLGDGMLIAHNAPFDFGFMNAELARLKRPALERARMVDTLALAKARFPGMPNSLDALCRRFGIDLAGRGVCGTDRRAPARAGPGRGRAGRDAGGAVRRRRAAHAAADGAERGGTGGA
jgi:DNA polymerase-3 subunit epsilon